jgi:glutaredoxin-like protein
MYLNSAAREAIAKKFATLASPVTLIFFEQSIGCETCASTKQLLEQLSEISDKVAIEVFDLALDRDRAAEYGIDRVPAIVVSAHGRARVRFYGAPHGNELMSLVEAVRLTAAGDSGLGEQSRERLRGLSRPVDLKVFFTPTCVDCPRMVKLACQLAVESPLVTTTAIDATEYPELVRRYRVNGVPKTVIDDHAEVMGAVLEAELVAAIC